jgi:RNA polymerase sigma factor (TIGR02999 family)
MARRGDPNVPEGACREPEPPGAATRELQRWCNGDAGALERLLPLVYRELRAVAGQVFRGQRADQTLQPTALVHEAFLRLVGQQEVGVRDRAHLRALVARAMRQVLTDHARRRRAQKRGGEARRATLIEPATPADAQALDLLVLDEVLALLERLDARQHRLVELRFFAGLEMEEIALVMEVSPSTIEREWRAARAWLGARLRERGVG